MRRLVTDTLIIAERNLIRLPRKPELLLAFTVQPIMFVLLFRYVFGGAINTGGVPYVDYLIPGIIVQNIAFGGFVTASVSTKTCTRASSTASGRCRWRVRRCWRAARCPTSSPTSSPCACW